MYHSRDNHVAITIREAVEACYVIVAMLLPFVVAFILVGCFHSLRRRD